MPESEPALTSWPQARHLAAAAGLWSLFVVYGSLTPFQFQPLPWEQAAQIVQSIAQQPLQPTSRGDWVTNVMLLLPFGWAALGALLVDRDRPARRWTAIGLVLVLGLMLSIGVEVAQLWFPPRHPSKSDVLAQTLGSASGMGLWVLAGQGLIDWLRHGLSGGRSGRAVALLQAYAAGLFLFSLLPLDLTIRLGDLWEKYKSEQVAVVPFAHWKWDANTFAAALLDVAAMWPVGMLAALWPRREPRSASGIIVRWLAGIGFVGCVEFCQLFVRSRFSDVTDLIIGAVGVSGGLWMTVAWRSQHGIQSGFRRWLPLFGVLAVGALLLVIYLLPFDYVADYRQATQRLAAMFRMPLEILRQGEMLAMVTNVLRKLLLFGAFGWLAGETARAISKGRIAARLLTVVGTVAGLLMAGSIEGAQAWFPPHVPDVTDILWGAVGGGLGTYLGRQAPAASEHRSS